jgi:ribose 5-phosphate isomerase A
MPQDNLAAYKQAAAEAAAALVEDGMLIGLGTGTTAAFVIEVLGKRVEQGLRIRGIPTSERSAEQARNAGIPLTDFASRTRLDLTIDGADEVEIGSLNLIKGRGGALLREKIVASLSRQLVVIVDETKLVKHLGAGVLPIEVVPFGWQATLGTLSEVLRTEIALRKNSAGQPFVTDNGHYIVECVWPQTFTPTQLQAALDGMTGVVDHGLFLNMAAEVFVGGPRGVARLKR